MGFICEIGQKKKHNQKNTQAQKKSLPAIVLDHFLFTAEVFSETQQRVHFAIVHPDVRNIHIKWTWVCVQTAATDTQHEYKLHFF